MSPWLVRTILYPLHERLRGRSTYRFLRDLRRTERLSPDEVGALTEERAVALVRHALTRVPWWRELGIAPGDVRDLADLERLPTMDKPFIREHLERLVADGWRDRVFKLETGGSSGVPLIFYTDKDRESSQLAAKMRAREWWDIHMGDRQVDLWGSPIELSANDRMRVWKDRLLNFRLLNAFNLSDEQMAGYRDVLFAHRTQFLYGYASVLARYAAFLEDRGEDLHDLGLKGAITTAELLFPDQRERIERAFGCKAINEYGCRDGGYIAQECPEGRMHLASDTVHVEILDDDQKPVAPGEVGEIALTNLHGFGMPLIRYRLGDRACLLDEPCPCGRSLPLLGGLEGRVTDTLFTPDGNRVHGLGMMYVLRVLDGVERFQVIQDALDHVEILVVGKKEVAGPVEEGARKTLGDRMKIDVRMVESIPPSASGKMRSIWNKMV